MFLQLRCHGPHIVREGLLSGMSSDFTAAVTKILTKSTENCTTLKIIEI